MRVFISYKRENQPFAETLRDRLQAWGLETWLDVDDIPIGTTPFSKGWDDAIHQGMQASQVVLGVLTPLSLQSENVLDEWGWALSNNRRLLILALEDVSSEAVPPRYIRIQRLDFRTDHATAYTLLQKTLQTSAVIIPSTARPTNVYHEVEFKLGVAKRNYKRAVILEQVYENWIVGVLEDALNEIHPFEIGLDLAERGALLKHIDYGDYQLDSTYDIWQIFNDMRRELVILGEPGSGKTILLLQLAKQLLIDAQNDANQPIPLIFNLASWSGKRETFQAWLIGELSLAYHLPKSVALDWIAQEAILLLLDGLDEVAPQYRDECIRTINSFHKLYQNIPIVICSRIKEYKILTEKLNLRGGIELKTLTETQIHKYTSVPDLAGLDKLLKAEEVLQTMARSPFLLNTMAYAYYGLTPPALQLEAGQTRKHDVFDRYVKRRLQKDNIETTFAHAKTRHYLNWLGWQMRRHSQSVFYIEEIQPDWLMRLSAYYNYHVVVAVVFGLIVSLFASTVFGLFFGVGSGLVFGMSFASIFAFLNRWSSESLYLSFSHKSRLERFRELMEEMPLGIQTFGLLLGILVILEFTLVLGLMGGLGASSAILKLGIFLFVGLCIVVGARLLFTLAIVLTEKIIGIPAQSLLVGLSIGFLIEVYYSISSGTNSGLAGGVIGGLIGGIINSFKSTKEDAIVEHHVLRLMLRFNDYGPLNYDKFLNYCTQRKLLRKIGRGYIFVHRELRDYFAEQYEIKRN